MNDQEGDLRTGIWNGLLLVLPLWGIAGGLLWLLGR